MNKIIDFINMYIAFLNGEIDYNDYFKFVRRIDNIIIQFIFLASFLLIAGFIFEMPLPLMIAGNIILLYGILLQSRAENRKQSLIYAFIWAITSFLGSFIVSVKLINLGII